jgi:hypothetical protein
LSPEVQGFPGKGKGEETQRGTGRGAEIFLNKNIIFPKVLLDNEKIKWKQLSPLF